VTRRKKTEPTPPAFSDDIAELGRSGDEGALAHYLDPAYYEETYRERRHDVDYYVRLAREHRRVLEYGIGNGRVALPMARAGARVFGIDLSRAMLGDLEGRLAREPKQVRARVDFRHGDMRSVRLDERFPLVIAPFNCILHLYERTDVEAFFARVREHLEPGGLFVFDFSLPQPADLARDPEKSYPAPRFRDPTSGKLVRYSERFEYDSYRQLLLVRMEFTPEGEPVRTVPLTHRQFFPREMEALLHYNGFVELEFTADFGDQLADSYTDSLVVRCRARE
jgi:SAM-dependent methyltransferase